MSYEHVSTSRERSLSPSVVPTSRSRSRSKPILKRPAGQDSLPLARHPKLVPPPSSSGATDYMEFIFANCLTPHDIANIGSWRHLRYASLCSGFGTEALVMKSLSMAMKKHTIEFKPSASFQSESCQWKACASTLVLSR